MRPYSPVSISDLFHAVVSPVIPFSSEPRALPLDIIPSSLASKTGRGKPSRDGATSTTAATSGPTPSCSSVFLACCNCDFGRRTVDFLRSDHQGSRLRDESRHLTLLFFSRPPVIDSSSPNSTYAILWLRPCKVCGYVTRTI